MQRVQVEIMGLSTSPSSGGAYALILKELHGHRRLPIIIGAFEAQAIALEMEHIKPPRPMTHDLLRSVIDAFGATVAEVTISELRDGTFYARISIDAVDGGEVDSRPSDAVALAVRYGVPIYVSEEVLEEAGYIPEEEEEDEPAAAAEHVATRERQLEQLQEQLQAAIQKEDYEEAARVRDVIRNIQAGD
ncbi:MAG: bifunctional nuclease family protein [Ignavibacteriae bacterium]|nr:bifunctional nuclease family protein [Ignavibacteriota bacterium]